jgi:hypothetical protein
MKLTTVSHDANGARIPALYISPLLLSLFRVFQERDSCVIASWKCGNALISRVFCMTQAFLRCVILRHLRHGGFTPRYARLEKKRQNRRKMQT